jgi:uncharacterized protein (TIGR00725 family)
MDIRQRPRVGVMGPGECSDRVRKLARDVGSGIARAGGVLICGGRGGVMEAAAQGAKEAGGLTVGILPGASAEEANSYIDIPVVTGMGHARNVINVLTSQVVIAISGGPGTLSEIALALKCGTPVVGLETWGLVAPEQPAAAISFADSPEVAVSLALQLARGLATA